MRTLWAFLLAGALALGAAGCGDGGGGCPGKVCSNCALGHDCDLDCPTGQIEVCESLANFGGSPDLRCAYCEPE